MPVLEQRLQGSLLAILMAVQNHRPWRILGSLQKQRHFQLEFSWHLVRRLVLVAGQHSGDFGCREYSLQSSKTAQAARPCKATRELRFTSWLAGRDLEFHSQPNQEKSSMGCVCPGQRADCCSAPVGAMVYPPRIAHTKDLM